MGCWEDNHDETRTIAPEFQQLLDAHSTDPAGVVMVADADMMTLSNLTAPDEAGLGFIVGSKPTRAPYDPAEHTRSHRDAYSDGQLMETTTPKRGVKDLTGESMRCNRPAWTPQASPDHWRAVWLYSSRRFTHDNQAPTAQEKEQGQGRCRRGEDGPPPQVRHRTHQRPVPG